MSMASPFSIAWNTFFLKGGGLLAGRPGRSPPKSAPTEEETYGDVPPDEHPFYGKEGYRGSEQKLPQAEMDDPKLVTQEKFDEKEKPRFDTSTPPNPFSKAWLFLKQWEDLPEDWGKEPQEEDAPWEDTDWDEPDPEEQSTQARLIEEMNKRGKMQQEDPRMMRRPNMGGTPVWPDPLALGASA